jgi:DNA segregation ATPase FtsK/SpoIIIE-like protein
MADADNQNRDSIDGRIERAKDAALGSHDDNPSLADELGEATGGISGVLVGAGIGSAAGPVGILICGIAGALGGWWAGRAVAEAASALTHEDEAHFRGHFDSLSQRPADRAYDDVRPAYYLGQIASHNPNFTAREFDEVEPELERGWASYSDKYGSWTAVRNYAAEGFTRGRSKLDDSAHRAVAQQEARTKGELQDRRS